MQMLCGHIMMYLESINLEKREGNFYLQSNVLSCEGIVLCDYTEEKNAEEGGGGVVNDETSPALFLQQVISHSWYFSRTTILRHIPKGVHNGVGINFVNGNNISTFSLPLLSHTLISRNNM